MMNVDLITNDVHTVVTKYIIPYTGVYRYIQAISVIYILNSGSFLFPLSFFPLLFSCGLPP